MAIDNLRGRLRDIFALRPYFDRFEPGRFRLIILDAFYRFMPLGGDENDNATMAGIYNAIDAYADRLGCAFVLIHHSTKGNQSSKSVTDVGAGAGSQSRATDSHLVLRPHEESGCVVLDAAVRSWAPIDPAGLRWSFPVWDFDPSLDPTQLRQERPSKRKADKQDEADEAEAWDVERFVGEFISAEPVTLPELRERAASVPGLSWRRVGDFLSMAKRGRGAISEMLARDDRYELMATADDMRLERYENRAQWQRMAQQLLNAYAERYYRYIRGRWEAPYLEVAEIAPGDPNRVEGYVVETTDLVQTAQQIEQIATFIEGLKTALGQNLLATWSQWGGRWRTVAFGGHLYQPLLHVGKNAEIRISPVALDKWEAEFVQDLAKWCTANRGREVYLLRNQAVTGLGFFQATNFFPDFLLWVQEGERQQLAFVDPKGLHHFDPSDPKVQFATRDVPRLQQIVAQQTPDLQLHAFILSNTPFASIGSSRDAGQIMSKAEVERMGVLFQVDDATTYISSLMTATLSG